MLRTLPIAVATRDSLDPLRSMSPPRPGMALADSLFALLIAMFSG